MKQTPQERISRILETDKEDVTKECAAACRAELLRVAQEFFEVERDFELKVERTKKGMAVTYCFEARRAKNFTVLK